MSRSRRPTSSRDIVRKVERRHRRVGWFLVLAFAVFGAFAFYAVTFDELERSARIKWGLGLVAAVVVIMGCWSALRPRKP